MGQSRTLREEVINMNDKTLAFVIDGNVVSVMRFDERTASIMLSAPKIIDISNQNITESWKYDNNKGFYIQIDGEEIVANVQ